MSFKYMDKVTCKKAKSLDDAKFLSFTFRPANTKYYQTKKVSFNEAKKLVANNTKRFYILWLGNNRIGHFNIKSREPGKYDFGIIIDKKYQGKGYGKEAMQLIEKEVAKLGGKAITLQVFKDNKRAINLYKKSGFKQVAVKYVMEKKIK